MDLKDKNAFIAIARIARTRGNRGEVLADLHTDYPDRFDVLNEVWLESANGKRRIFELEDVWDHKGRKVLKFASVNTISEAEEYVGCWVVIPLEQAVTLPEGTYFDHDLIGCAVEDSRGNQLGVVGEILHVDGNTLLVARRDGPELLIPAVKDICAEISVAEKRIRINPPDGLTEL